MSRTVFSRTFSIVLRPSRNIPACSRPLSVCLLAIPIRSVDELALVPCTFTSIFTFYSFTDKITFLHKTPLLLDLLCSRFHILRSHVMLAVTVSPYGHEIIHAESLRAYKHAYRPTTAHGYIITHTVPLCCVWSHESRTRSRYYVHTIISLFGSLLAGTCLYDHRTRNTAFLTLQHTIFTLYSHASRSRSQYHVPNQDIIYAEPLRAFVTVNCLAFVLDFTAADYIASC